jgi:ubiquinone biosynthesis protein Coq4
MLGVRVLWNPKDIQALLRAGDLLTDTEGSRRATERVRADPEAACRIEERYSPEGISLAWLSRFPSGTLGADYRAHMVRHGLDFYSTRASSAASDRAYVRERVRETHDILHAVLGYDISIAEEAGLNAFLMVQFALPIPTLIVAGALIHTLFKQPSDLPAVIDKILEGCRLGRCAKNALSMKWEEQFDRPTEEIRRELGLPAKANEAA